jgi:hypothetical protein
MRFFSNDSRQSSDDQARVDHPERVQSEPVPVPQQRPPSPWAATPSQPADPSEDETSDKDAETVTDDHPEFHPPAPAPTALGASSVGGAVAASAQANPLTGTRSDDQDLTDDNRDGTGAARHSSFAPPSPGTAHHAGAHAGTHADSSPDAASDSRSDSDPGARAGDRPGHHDDVIDVPLEDGGTFEDPVAVEPGGSARTFAGSAPVTSTPASSPSSDADTSSDDSGSSVGSGAVRLGDRTPGDDAASDRDAVGTAGRDAADRDADRDSDDASDLALDSDHDSVRDSDSGRAAVVSGVPGIAAATDEDTSVKPGSTESTSTSTEADSAPAPVASAPAEQLPGTVAAPELGPLFADQDAHTFRDRWRDVQLRFVDDPKAAADDAASLVDEAVDALAASLRSQKDTLNDAAENTSNDTEQLRVRIRAYRDFLDRLLGL